MKDTHSQNSVPRFEKHVVIPDLHGEYAMLQQVIDCYYDDDAVGFVSLGDIVNRRRFELDKEAGVKRTVDLIHGLGSRAVVLYGNHEWNLTGAVFDRSRARREAWQLRWLGSMVSSRTESNTLSAYGVEVVRRNYEKTAQAFKNRLDELGHSHIFTDALLYYETDQFIAVHAGIDLKQPWEQQRAGLQQKQAEASQGIYQLKIPEEIVSFRYACDTSYPEATPKTIVSGHAHVLALRTKENQGVDLSTERSLHGGQRIRLASELRDGEPLYVWEDWTRKIRMFEQAPDLAA